MKILRVAQVAERIGAEGVATVWRRVRMDATFPRPVKIGPNSTGWLEHEVDEWIAKKAAERPAAHPPSDFQSPKNQAAKNDACRPRVVAPKPVTA